MISTDMSASMNSIARKSRIGRPNCTRSPAYRLAISAARMAAPRQLAAICSRASTNQSLVSSKPWPISPSILSAPFSLAARHEIVALLRRGAVAQREGGMPDHRPERAGRLAEPLADQGLLEDGEALAAILARMVDAVESVFDDGFAQARQSLGRQM